MLRYQRPFGVHPFREALPPGTRLHALLADLGVSSPQLVGAPRIVTPGSHLDVVVV